MDEYYRGAKVVYIRETPHIWIGKSLHALCRLCGEPVDDRKKKSARLHKKCAYIMSSTYRRRLRRGMTGYGA